MSIAKATLIASSVVILTSSCGHKRATAFPTMRLCIPTGISRRDVAIAGRITGRRLESYHIEASVTWTVGTRCMAVHFLQPVTHTHLRNLGQVLAEQGQFVQGVAVSHPSSQLQGFARIRYASDRITRANRSLPVVRPIFTWRGVDRASVALVSPLPPGPGHVVNFNLTPDARRAFCRFSTSHRGEYSPSIFDRVVFEDSLITGPVCGGRDAFVPVPPQAYSRFSRLGPRALFAYLRFGPLPFSWQSVKVVRGSSS